jgi:hypothetical protein
MYLIAAEGLRVDVVADGTVKIGLRGICGIERQRD